MKTLVILCLMTLFSSVATLAAEKVDEKRLDEVAGRGKHVMPFDLEKTIHVFFRTDQGGIQQVNAKNDTDVEQIELIRAHLKKIAQEFGQGDFSDPEQIHGADMPGLAVLRTAKPGEISMKYSELPNGAQIDYSSENPEYIQAIHQWFDAQLSDHARHAVPGHHHHGSGHK